jgi:H/ACA ribonucleoprotein complex non-core subunit NAF1
MNVQIYETFGPTSQPLYQVKFSNSYPLDPEKMRISRNVFHLPRRSRFVFLNQIKQMKGSDASNVHDEEPADYELEFSDDEAEAAFKNGFKRKYVYAVLDLLDTEVIQGEAILELHLSPHLGS